MTSTERRKLSKTEVTELAEKMSDLSTRRSELEVAKKALVKPTNDELKHISNQLKVCAEMWETKSIAVDKQLNLLEDYQPVLDEDEDDDDADVRKVATAPAPKKRGKKTNGKLEVVEGGGGIL